MTSQVSNDETISVVCTYRHSSIYTVSITEAFDLMQFMIPFFFLFMQSGFDLARFLNTDIIKKVIGLGIIIIKSRVDLSCLSVEGRDVDAAPCLQKINKKSQLYF